MLQLLTNKLQTTENCDSLEQEDFLVKLLVNFSCSGTRAKNFQLFHPSRVLAILATKVAHILDSAARYIFLGRVASKTRYRQQKQDLRWQFSRKSKKLCKNVSRSTMRIKSIRSSSFFSLARGSSKRRLSEYFTAMLDHSKKTKFFLGFNVTKANRGNEKKGVFFHIPL